MGIIPRLTDSLRRHATHKLSTGEVLFPASCTSSPGAALGDSKIPQDEHVRDLRFELIHPTLLKPIRAEVYSLEQATWGGRLMRPLISRSEDCRVTERTPCHYRQAKCLMWPVNFDRKVNANAQQRHASANSTVKEWVPQPALRGELDLNHPDPCGITVASRAAPDTRQRWKLH